MATDPQESTPQSLQSQYEAEFTRHLTDNREEQARLRKRLEQLVADEAWLVRALEAVSAPAGGGTGAQGLEDGAAHPQDSTSGPAEAAEGEAPAAVPQQRQDKPTGPRAKKTTAGKTSARNATSTRKPAAKKTSTAKKTAAKAGEPPLGKVLLAVLGAHAGQPRTAAEVAGDLERKYPERARDSNTVRNTLERLVAKGRVERTKQKNTVLYTAVPESAPDTAGAAGVAAEAAPAAETAGAQETGNAEKVPVQA